MKLRKVEIFTSSTDPTEAENGERIWLGGANKISPLRALYDSKSGSLTTLTIYYRVVTQSHLGPLVVNFDTSSM